MTIPYKKFPVIPVKQPLGTFYICSIPSDQLLELSYADALTITGIDPRMNSSYKLTGNQREQILEKRKSIGKYIDGVEATFPNTVILGANVDENGYQIKDIDQKWDVIEEAGQTFMIIPVKKKNARIIDGQHRLTGFEYSEKKVVFDIPCSIFLDLPLSLQASIFATININQKKVDRSLAFELFGYDLENEPMESWSPEKLAIFITRKLNVDDGSPLKGNIKVVARYNKNLFDNGEWVIATSVFVDGIMALISTNPMKDRESLNYYKTSDRKRLSALKLDSSPLRSQYLEYNDKLIYTIVSNFFTAVVAIFFNKPNVGYINKTVGIQALFDVLKVICVDALEKRDISVNQFVKILTPASTINFNDLFFQASGIGRSRIRNILLLSLNLISIQKIKEKDRAFYNNLLANEPSTDDQEKWIWEDEAETELMRILEHAEWNTETHQVQIFYGPDDEKLTFGDFEEFQSKLIEIAEQSVADNLPGDQELADLYRDKFDAQKVVDEQLADFKPELEKLGWNI